VKLAVDIRKTLHAMDRTFTLDVRFTSDDDLIVIFGPSGSGKSVTFQAIAGLVSPDEGQITLGGRTLFDSAQKVDVRPQARRIGYLFQDYALFPHLTVRENVGFALGDPITGHLSLEAGQAVSELLRSFELSELAESHPKQLSGGQRQRVALARALAKKPELLLLDEPFSALDPLLRDRTRRELLAIQARFKVPMVIITHDPADVELFADHLILFENGRAVEDLSQSARGAASSDRVKELLSRLY